MEMIEAKLNPAWLWRMVIITVALAGWSVYCLYDAKIAYPAHDEEVAAFLFAQPATAMDDEEYVPRYEAAVERSPEMFSRLDGNEDGRLDSAERSKAADAWKALTEERGGDGENPGEAPNNYAYIAQWAQLGICAPLALLVLVWILRSATRRVAADQQTLYYGPCEIPFSAITDIDKAKWDKKGIAIGHYRLNDRDGAVKLDDWIFRGTVDVLEELEHRTGRVGA